VTQINLPNKSVTGTNFWSQVEDNDQVIADVVNGDLDASNLADGAVTTAKIGDSQVTTDKLNNGAVTGAKLAASSTANATNGSGVTGTLTARKYSDGLVVLTGRLTKTAGWNNAETAGTLPAGYRPSANLEILIVGDTGSYRPLVAIVRTTGVIDIFSAGVGSGNPTALTVNNISFHAA